MDKAYVEQRGDLAVIGNRQLELVFDLSAGGALVGMLDKSSGHQFLRDGRAPRLLFRLALRRQDDRALAWLDSSQAGRCAWTGGTTADGASLALVAAGFAGRALQVSVQISLGDAAALSIWHMEVREPGAAAVYQMACPIVPGVVMVGEGLLGETVVYPRHGEGMIYRDPFPVVDRLPLKSGAGPDTPQAGIGELHGIYPGQLPVQMMLYYNQAAGLYLATHDSTQEAKSFDLGPLPGWVEFPVFSISHFPSEAMASSAATAYETVVGVFHGDWYDGADIYKAWATRQWWCEQKLTERDIASWLRRGFGVFQMSNYHLPTVKLDHSLSEIAELVNRLAGESGVPLLALVFNFEGAGGWTGPIGFFPPREGEEPFRAAMARLRQAGNLGFLYMPGGNWYIAISSYDPPFDSWPEFEAQGRPHATMGADGQVQIGRWYAGWEAARLCPQSEYTHDLTAALVLGCIERGAPVVQIDNFPCGGTEACYDKRHGHPIGYGRWWSEAWNRILAETRRRAKALDPDAALTTEGISENFIPYLDLYDQRAGNMEYFGHWRAGDPLGAEAIPLFNYLYNQYIGSYCAAYPECNRPEVLYWTRCLGKSLTQGVVPTGGWYYPEPRELNPVTLGFFKKVVRAAAQECWPYIMFGEMLRPPQIDVPRIQALYIPISYGDVLDPARLHRVEDAAVQHSAWRGPDGCTGFIFVNVSEAPVDFAAEITGADGPGVYRLEQVVDGERSLLAEHAWLPLRQQIYMAPLSMLLIEVSRGG